MAAHGFQDRGFLLTASNTVKDFRTDSTGEGFLEFQLDNLTYTVGQIQGDLNPELGLVVYAKTSFPSVSQNQIIVAGQAQYMAAVDRHEFRGVLDYYRFFIRRPSGRFLIRCLSDSGFSKITVLSFLSQEVVYRLSAATFSFFKQEKITDEVELLNRLGVMSRFNIL